MPFPEHTSAQAFSTTAWSMVARAGEMESDAAAAALERLCRTYWRPIYAWLRRSGHAPADAEDLTQGFLLSLIQRRSLETADRARGRFRSFLLAALTHYVSDQRDKARAQKRGGGAVFITLDEESLESACVRAAARDDETPERAFDRQFAEALFARARQRVREECAARGKLALYEALGPEAAQGAHSGLEARGEALGLTAQAARNVAHRLRQRYRECIEDELREITASAEDAREERQHLISSLN
jgi:DNA-directed RNA polymerase specialized sigma24 family protein